MLTFALLAACLTASGPHADQIAEHAGEPAGFFASEPAPELGARAVSTFALSRRVYGYLPYWIRLDVSTLPWDRLSDLVYMGVDLNDDGTMQSNHSFIAAGATSSPLVEAVHAKGGRAHITAWTVGSPDALVGSATARTAAINVLKDQVRRSRADGLNIDFEFVTAARAAQFVTFVSQLRTALDSVRAGLELTIAMPSYPPWYTGYDVRGLDPYVDRFLLMEYDYHWSGSTVAGPVAPLRGGRNWSLWVEKAVAGASGYLSLTTPEKLALGVPYYGRCWPTVSTTAVPAATTDAGTSASVMYVEAVVQAPLHGRKWDLESLTPWYGFRDSTTRQCWYDDEESLGHKYDTVNRLDLAGVMIWALGYDQGRTELWQTLADKFVPEVAVDGGSDADSGAGDAGDGVDAGGRADGGARSDSGTAPDAAFARDASVRDAGARRDGAFIYFLDAGQGEAEELDEESMHLTGTVGCGSSGPPLAAWALAGGVLASALARRRRR